MASTEKLDADIYPTTTPDFKVTVPKNLQGNKIYELGEKIGVTKFKVDGLKKEIDKLKSDMRMMERKIEKCELREKQFIILFKQVLDFYTHRYKKGKHITIQQIVSYMNGIIRSHMTVGEQEQNIDLVEELIKKGGVDGL